MGTRAFDLLPEAAPLTLWTLRQHLFAGIEDWADPQSPVLLMSVNQSLTRADPALQAGDEVAFFSPFSGG